MRLTNADLAEIKKRANYVIENAEWESATVTNLIEDDVPALLAEVERLRFSLESIVNIDGRYVDTEFDVEDAYKIIDEIAREALSNGE